MSAYESLCPTPVTMLEDKLDLTKFYELVNSGTMRTSYLNCTEDTAMPHGEFAWHPRFSSRLGLCRIVQMAGSHEAIFHYTSDPRREAGRSRARLTRSVGADVPLRGLRSGTNAGVHQ